MDLTQPDLRYLAAQLQGSLLRLGGSPVDSLLYETPDTPLACTDAELNKTQPSPSGGYYCPNWDQVNYIKSPGAHCLKAGRWKEINSFALQAGFSIAFGLNACWLRPNAAGEMDWTYVDAMLKQTASLAVANASAVWAWEFGNELYRSGVHADRYGKDVKELMSRSEAAWGAAEVDAGLEAGSLQRPVFVGPDNGFGAMPTSYVTDFVDAAEGAVHAVTFHDYGNPCSSEMPADSGLAINVSCVDERTASVIQEYGGAARSGGVELWCGEGAFHASSGVRGLTDVFRGSLWFAHKLGSYFSSGVTLFARQTLLGGDYELVNRTTAAPAPDYYVLLLWRRLIGERALPVETTGSETPGLRTFAFDAAPGLQGRVVVAINSHTDLEVTATLGHVAQVYQLSGDLASSRIFYNARFGGNELVYQPGGGGLPAMDPYVAGASVPLPPCSITWVHLDGSSDFSISV
jgi:heparanase 1